MVVASFATPKPGFATFDQGKDMSAGRLTAKCIVKRHVPSLYPFIGFSPRDDWRRLFPEVPRHRLTILARAGEAGSVRQGVPVLAHFLLMYSTGPDAAAVCA